MFTDPGSSTGRPRVVSVTTASGPTSVSAWVTPRHPSGWEGILRYDWIKPNRAVDADRGRTIVGAAYWFPKQGAVSTALLLDYEDVNNSGFTPVQPDQRRVAVHMLVNWQ